MAEIVLFHHVLGLNEGVAAMAERWRQAGHTVHTPDLFDGTTFASIEAGVAHVDDVGMDAIVDRGVEAAAALGEGLVYAGISLGVVPAQRLAQTRSGARGAVLMEACVPGDYFADQWPAAVPVQIHGMDRDPFFAGEGDIDAARAIVDAVGSDMAELHLYDGDSHLFVDASTPAHVPEAAALVDQRILAFLASLDAG